MNTTYNRQFMFSASHFNGAETYRLWNMVARSAGPIAFADVLRLLRDQHGHNFMVTISASSPLNDDFVVDDDVIAAVAMRWHNTNVTLHPDFVEDDGTVTGRCSLENMTRKMHALLLDKYPLVSFTVTIQETPQISATFGG